MSVKELLLNKSLLKEIKEKCKEQLPLKEGELTAINRDF